MAISTIKHTAMITLLAFGTSHSWSLQPTPCQQQAKTPLEEAYCQVVAKGEGQKLPSLFDFRNNSTTMQRLLLKAPAKRAGVTLPPPAQKAHTAPTAPINTPAVQSLSQHSLAAPAETPADKPPAQSTALQNQTELAQCMLTAFSIRCPTGEYTLQNNRQNHELQLGALDTANRMELATRNSRAFSAATDRQYLSAVYRTYIEKMLAIGLGGATMSFTKFAATYADHVKNGTDFCVRFYDMYELLKKERKINGVKSRYNSDYPTAIEQCMLLSPALIVCDNVQDNWIYKRP